MKNNKIKNIVIIIFVLLLVLIIGFIIYDKIIENGENNHENGNETIKNNRESCDISNLESPTTKNCFQEYIKYIPLRYENSSLSSYNASDLTNKEISMAVWRYIYYINEGFSADGETKLSQEKVNNYLKEYLNLENYDLMEMEITDNQAFGLKKNGNDYVITVQATEFSFSNFEVTNILYDDELKEVIIVANNYYIEMSEGDKIIDSIVTIKLKHNKDKFNLISFKINKDNQEINNNSKYSIRELNSPGQCQEFAIYKDNIEILRGLVEIISTQGATYFIDRIQCGTEAYGELLIYNTDLKSIRVGAKQIENRKPSQANTYYLTSIKNEEKDVLEEKIWTTDFSEVYEYDYDFNIKNKLSEKITIKDYKILGIVDRYAFLQDKNYYLYAINLITYELEKTENYLEYEVKMDPIGSFIYLDELDSVIINDSGYKYKFGSGFEKIDIVED